MTNLLCYLSSPVAYENKFLNATKLTLGHIPNIEGILKTIKGQPYRTIKNIITLLTDITIITTSRQHNRAFPPPNVFAQLCSSSREFRKISVQLRKLKADLNVTLHTDTAATIREHLTMSGLQSAIFYRWACRENICLFLIQILQ